MAGSNSTFFVVLDPGRSPDDVNPFLPDGQPGPGYGILNETYAVNASGSRINPQSGSNSSVVALIGISLLFCSIGIVGIAGNSMIIFIIGLDKKMRRSVTNLFIMNLALSDLLIMLFGVPETVQFILNRGWLLGEVTCRVERYVLVVSLYSSVVTAVAVCVER